MLGRSNIVGMPVAHLLQSMDATVTVCHSRTADLPSHVLRADIVVAAIGNAEMVKVRRARRHQHGAAARNVTGVWFVGRLGRMPLAWVDPGRAMRRGRRPAHPPLPPPTEPTFSPPCLHIPFSIILSSILLAHEHSRLVACENEILHQ